MKPATQILSAVQLDRRTAAWVLSAHLYALLVPLVFSLAIWRYWDYLVDTTYQPFLFFVAAVLFSAGAAFEVAQNTMDNWYLTEETASANGVGFCDFLFYLCITAGQAVSAIAIGGDKWWVVAIAVGAVFALPPIYFVNGPYFAPLGVTNIVAIGLAFAAFGDPVVWLQLLITGATIYFFEALLRSGAQTLHGFTTLSASSGVWFLVWAIANGASGNSVSWVTIVSVSLVAVAAGAALWPRLRRLPPSRRNVPEPA
jgi:hypothetical protein